MEKPSRPRPTSPRAMSKRRRKDTLPHSPHLPARPSPPGRPASFSRVSSYHEEPEDEVMETAYIGRYSVTEGPAQDHGLKAEPGTDSASEGTPASDVGIRIMGTALSVPNSRKEDINQVIRDLPQPIPGTFSTMIGSLNGLAAQLREQNVNHNPQLLTGGHLRRLAVEFRDLYDESRREAHEDRVRVGGLEEEVERLQGDNEDLLRERDRLRFDLTRAHRELDLSEADIRRLRQDRENGERDINDMKRRGSELKGQVEALNKKLVTSEQAKAGLTHEIKNLKSGFMKEINNLKTEASLSDEKSKGLVEQVETLSGERDNLGHVNKMLKDETERLKVERDQLKREMYDLESANRSLRDKSEAQAAETQRLGMLIGQQDAQLTALRSASVGEMSVLEEAAAQLPPRVPSPDIKLEPGMAHTVPETMLATAMTTMIPPFSSTIPLEQSAQYFCHGVLTLLVRYLGVGDLNCQKSWEYASNKMVMEFMVNREASFYQQQDTPAVGFWKLEDAWAADTATGRDPHQSNTDNFLQLCLLVPLLREQNDNELFQTLVTLLGRLSQPDLEEWPRESMAFLEAMASLQPPLKPCAPSVQNIILSIAVCEFCRFLQDSSPAAPRRGWTIASVLGEDMYEVAQKIPLGMLDISLANPDRSDVLRLRDDLQGACGDQFCFFAWDRFEDGVSRELGLLHCSRDSDSFLMIDFKSRSFRLVDRQLADMRPNFNAPKKFDLLITKPDGEVLFEMLAAPKDVRTFWSQYVLDDD
ncbi:hypothetical protein OQA88_9557 [Cercophora sp. LCS_1]